MCVITIKKLLIKTTHPQTTNAEPCFFTTRLNAFCRVVAITLSMPANSWLIQSMHFDFFFSPLLSFIVRWHFRSPLFHIVFFFSFWLKCMNKRVECFVRFVIWSSFQGQQLPHADIMLWSYYFMIDLAVGRQTKYELCSFRHHCISKLIQNMRFNIYQGFKRTKSV